MAQITSSSSSSLARKIVVLLKQLNIKLVLAESCTSGAIAATFGSIPGVSQVFCGSAVTYREDTKINWLGISKSQLKKNGDVTRSIAEAMAVGVLENTPEASIALSITGHLGPNAPKMLDGVGYVAIIKKSGRSKMKIERHQWVNAGRSQRQKMAVHSALTLLHSELVESFEMASKLKTSARTSNNAVLQNRRT